MNVRLNSITTSRRWLMPRQRIETMPTLGFDFDSRSSRISLSAQSVSPSKTGFGSLMSVHGEVGGGVLARVRNGQAGDEREREALLTSGLPNCVRSA